MKPNCADALAGLTFRAVDIQELAEEYGSKSDEELLRLALQPAQLTPEANAALAGELAKRRINGREHLEAARQQERERKAERDKDPGRLFFIRPYGIGRKRFGKAERTYDADSGLERFKTTVFVVLFWLPLIPTGTYLVERKREFLSGEMTVLQKLPLDWEQVLKVWVVAAASLLAFIWVIKLLPRLLF
ncbi:MAG: hypothetical protein LAN37_15135 [Acidobacteriia bacterium]|nr:hypothetical protein [Terriglobia bacterium]